MCKKILLWFIAVAISYGSFAQQTKEEIQKRQQELQKELADLNSSLEAVKKNKKQSLGQLSIIQRKIRAREELVRTLNKQLHQLDDEIYLSNLQIYRYQKELDSLKQSYAKSLVFAYKNRSNYDYLNFIFSANSFNDALKRITYLRSYKQYRETQVNTIVKTQQLIQNKIAGLNNSKVEKNNTIKTQAQQLAEMEVDKKEKNQVVKQLQSQEKKISAQIKEKEKNRRQLQQALQAILKREIEEAKRKERERQIQQQQLAKQKNQSTPTTKNNTTNTPLASLTKSNRTYSPFESTEEGLTESINFESSRGKLPWPVNSGYVLIHFGSYEIPGTKLRGVSDGIDISLPVGATVKAVADGEVASVFDLGNEQTVVIRHGKYFTTYSHLSSVSVGKNDKVKAGTVIGKAAADDNGDGLLTFMVSNDKGSFLDPESWLKSR